MLLGSLPFQVNPPQRDVLPTRPTHPPHAQPAPSLPPHPHRFSKQKSEAERALQRKGRVWLLCAGAAIAAYVLLSGQYIQLELWDTEEYEEEEE